MNSVVSNVPPDGLTMFKTMALAGSVKTKFSSRLQTFNSPGIGKMGSVLIVPYE